MLLSVAEAAALLDVNPATVWRYIHLDHDPLPAERVGRAYTLWQSDVLAYQPKANRKRGPKPRRPADPA